MLRGPFIGAQLPLRTVAPGWESPLQWLPDGFLPFQHQADALRRLSVSGQLLKPTILTAASGSGKSESFLFPILDHSSRQRRMGRPGIKAIVVYRSSASAVANAAVVAKICSTDQRMSSVTGGLLLDDLGSSATAGPAHLVDSLAALCASPPDVLLTTPVMLNRLLQGRRQHEVFASTSPASLRYFVLDDLYGYDREELSELAVLVRRLGSRLRMSSATSALSGAVPVVTGAVEPTPENIESLCQVASEVLGTEFVEESLITETRQDVDEVCPTLNTSLPQPTVQGLAGIAVDDVASILAAFFASGIDTPLPANAMELSASLSTHPFTHAVLSAMSERCAIGEVVSRLGSLVPSWQNECLSDPSLAAQALQRFLTLLGVARLSAGSRTVPYVSLSTHVWVRETPRMMRRLDKSPEFKLPEQVSLASPGTMALSSIQDSVSEDHNLYLPAVFCNNCGRSGWLAAAVGAEASLVTSVVGLYRPLGAQDGHLRILMSAPSSDVTASHLDVASRRLDAEPADTTVPVHVSQNDRSAQNKVCPACHEPGSVEFIGTSTTALVSSTVDAAFGTAAADSSPKVLAMTDSVQEASIQASYLSDRSYVRNLRQKISSLLSSLETGGIQLSKIGQALLARATTTHDRFHLVPPDLRNDPAMQSLWSDTPDQDAAALLAQRLGFEADLQFGSRSCEPESLTGLGLAVTVAELGDLSEVRDQVVDALASELGEVPESQTERIDGYLLGLVDRLRAMGGFQNQLLEPYLRQAGDNWFISGGRPAGLPPFRDDQRRPRFLTTNAAGVFESVTADVEPLSGEVAWLADWGSRALGIDVSQARSVNQKVVESLSRQTEVVAGMDSLDGHRVYALSRQAVWIVDTSTPGRKSDLVRLECDMCAEQTTLVAAFADVGIGCACFRHGCKGQFQASSNDAGLVGGAQFDSEPSEHAGPLIGGAQPDDPSHRVVGDELTTATPQFERMTLEWKFRHGSLPDSPNVIVATPMVEARVDAAEVSTLVLASMPEDAATYWQLSGRAGSLTGSATIITVVPDSSMGLDRWAEPSEYLRGVEVPVWTDESIIKVKAEHYLAFLFDRVADQTILFKGSYDSMGDLMQIAHGDEGLVRAMAAASSNGSQLVDRFLDLFGERVDEATAGQISEFAANGVEGGLRRASVTWQNQVRLLDQRRSQLNAAVNSRSAKRERSDDETEELWQLAGYMDALSTQIQQLVGESWIDVISDPRMASIATDVDHEDDPNSSTSLTFALWHQGGDRARNLIIQRDGTRSDGLSRLAPGNDFHFAGHRQAINALDLGLDGSLAVQARVICPDCSYVSAGTDQVEECPRCGSVGFSDDSAVHQTVVPIGVLSTGSELSARVAREEATSVASRYQILTLVDVDPESVTQAWKTSTGTFGVERCQAAHIRDFSLPSVRTKGPEVQESAEVTPAVFVACRHCGGVKHAGVRPVGHDSSERPERLHQGWCGVRLGSEAEQWDSIHLLQDHDAPAVRLLIPISDFQATERLTSLKAALLVGATVQFGHAIDGLGIATATIPNRGGETQRQYLVIHSDDPALEQFLDAFGDVDQLREVLARARDLVAKCSCRHQGLDACNDCLLASMDKSEHELVRRELALETLEAILGGWGNPEPVRPDAPEGLSFANLAEFEQRELRRAFKIALQVWAACDLDVKASFLRLPDMTPGFELSITFQGKNHRYRLEESTDDGGPAFTITPAAEGTSTVAVYLESFASDPSERTKQIEGIARDRSERRSAGSVTWNITWADVRAFYKAGASSVPHEVADHLILSDSARRAANDAHEELDGTVSVDSIEQNSVALLLDFLARPGLEQWRRAMASTAEGLAASLDLSEGEGTYVDPDGVELSIEAVAGPGEASQALGGKYKVVATLPAGTEPADRSEKLAQWGGWLFWDNLLQFLDPAENGKGK